MELRKQPKMKPNSPVGLIDYIRNMLLRSPMNQSQLARLSGVHRDMINKIIHGHKTGITLATAEKLIHACGMSVTLSPNDAE